MNQSLQYYYNETTIIVDDRDASIAYTNGWTRAGTLNEWQHTVTGSMLEASGCGFAFNFTGGQPIRHIAITPLSTR